MNHRAVCSIGSLFWSGVSREIGKLYWQSVGYVCRIDFLHQIEPVQQYEVVESI
jgi:hypothetical protein